MNKILNYLCHHLPEKLSIDSQFFRARFFLFFFNLIPDFYTLSPLRNLFLKFGGAKIDIFDAYIRSPLWCSDLKHVEFGSGVFINMGCRFEGTAPTVIGDGCKIGPSCCFENVNHTAAGDVALPIVLGKGVWLGARVVVTPDTTIGANSIIAAGAVVSRNVPENEVWGGVPARKIKDVV